MPWWGIMLIILAVLGIAMFVLYRFGKNLQEKQITQKEQMVAAAQPTTMLIIDKKMLPLKDAGLPKMVMEQTPKRYQKAKLPIVKAKIGPQIMNLIADDAIFDDLPTKGEVKAMVSGIYIVSVKSIRGRKNPPAEEEETGKKKKRGFQARMREKQVKYQQQLNDEIRAKEAAKKSSGTKKPTTTSKNTLESVQKNATVSKEQAKKNKQRAKKITDGIK